MVASTDSKHNQSELKSDTTTDPLTMQCAENIQSKTKDEITENCAVQHAGKNKAAEQILYSSCLSHVVACLHLKLKRLVFVLYF
jgi:hypothetical protein